MKHSLTLVISAFLLFAPARADELDKNFVTPPPSARPHTWWHWMNGNVTKEGITADLEAMARVGIGGAQIVTVACEIPPGPVKFNSPEWREMVKFAVQEADRLGLELCVANAAGWSSSGGPWNTPEHAMQFVVTSEKRVQGPVRFDGELPKPKTPNKVDFYRDIAVLAFRTPSGEKVRMQDLSPKITTNGKGEAGNHLFDGDLDTTVELPLPKPGTPSFIQFEFAQPYTARSMRLIAGRRMGGFGAGACGGKIEVSDDGKVFRSIGTFSIPPSDTQPAFVAFSPVSARFYRVIFTRVSAPTMHLLVSGLEFSPSVTIEDMPAKAFYKRGKSSWVKKDPATGSADDVLSRLQMVDLSSRLGADGKLSWDVPAGDWTILRIGHAPTGARNHPAPGEGTGLECDKLSKEAVGAHWEGMMTKLLAELGPLAGKVLNNVLIDSYEVGTQNWTPKFREEFQKRRGYDLVPYLPVLSGRFVDSPEVTERFLWDFRRTIADLFAENYAGGFAELAHKNGLLFSVEPYGDSPSDNLQYGSYADIPMSEFWATQRTPGHAKVAASVAHVYGRKFVGAEAFTAPTEVGRWLKDPFALKVIGDLAWCSGVNRFIFHRYAMQPWTSPTRFPGMTMGKFGTMFERTTTWWEQSRAWLQYMARSQHLLQQGLFVADACIFVGDGAPNDAPACTTLPGYDNDAICAADLKRLSVKNRRLVLPDGMSYRILVLPSEKTMTLETARKIKELADAGAVIVGGKPTSSPGLSGYPACDGEIRKIAAATAIITDKTPVQVLDEQHIKPDFECHLPPGSIAFIHRRDGDADIYFVSNQREQFESVECTFRVSGKVPEIWHPDTGKIEQAAVWREENGRTTVPLDFDPTGSVFVVFRKKADGNEHIVEAKYFGADKKSAVPEKRNPPELQLEVGANGKVALSASSPGSAELKTSSGKMLHVEVRDVPKPVELSGPWELNFPPNWGAPAKVSLPRLISWPEHGDKGVKYFSGTATYVKEVEIPAAMMGAGHSLILDLGEVKNIAEVFVNGKPLGILWKPPFRADITGAVKPGKNTLEIKITNLWPNRLIGDEQLPEDCEWTTTGALKKWPQWLLEGKPSPTGRVTFTTWHHWQKGDAPLPSGLLGPVTITPEIAKLVE